MIASGFLGRDRSLTYGFTDKDGAFFIEYKRGKDFRKNNGEKFIHTLCRKHRHNRGEYKGMEITTDRFRKDCDEKILYWMDKVKTHMESIEKNRK